MGPSLGVTRMAQLERSFSDVSISFCGRMRAPAARHIQLHCTPGCRRIDHVPYRKYGKVSVLDRGIMGSRTWGFGC